MGVVGGGNLGRRWGFDNIMNGCNMCLPTRYQSHEIKGDEKSDSQFNRHCCFVQIKQWRKREKRTRCAHLIFSLRTDSSSSKKKKADNVVAPPYGSGK